MSEKVIDVEEKIESIDDNMLDPIDNSAINGQVELPVDPTEPEVEPSDVGLTAEEKKDFSDFEKEMDEIIAEAIPEIDATLDPTTQLSEDSQRAIEPGGYNPEEEDGENKLLDEIVDASKPVTAEFVQKEIVDAADRVLSAEPEEYTFNQNEVLVERDDDEVEFIGADKVDNIDVTTTNGMEIGDLSEKKVKDENTGETVPDFEVAVESDGADEVTDVIEKLEDDMEADGTNVIVEMDLEIKGQEPVTSEDHADLNKNMEVGELEISEVQVVTPDGVDNEIVDVTIPTYSETPLDEVNGPEVIHIETVSEADIESSIEKELKEMIGSESEGTDLNLGIVDGNQVVEKGNGGEVIVGDFTEVVMGVTAEANKDVDGEALKDFEITSGNPDEHVVIDETKDIEDRENGPIISESLEDFSEALDEFINGDETLNMEYDDII